MNPPARPRSSALAGSTPRPAATVVLVRNGVAGWPEVLLVRRSCASHFMPSTYVFPGGRVDFEDGATGSDAAFEAAARRECHEEVGLSLGQKLHWFDTWITPSAEPRRYLARFFMAALPGGAGAGAQARADEVETHDETWANVEDLLTRWALAELDLPPPTLATLLRMRGRSRSEVLELCEVDPREPILPKGVPLRGVNHVVMPPDPAYPGLPGMAAPAPARIHEYPPRFRREEQRWVPCPE